MEMLYLLYFFYLLQQMCMCDQWLILDLLRSGSTTLGVLWIVLLNKSERAFVGLILKLIGKSHISPKDYVLVW
jgi:hypothetical protein